ncbi:MAG: asparagine synthase-related protein [Natrialbaceae archaeon]|nr:asparagine synthase-related protein [Natrialbaceae archaeon]
MRCGLLYSGGKDSTLAALLLAPVADVTLVTASFGITDEWQLAREAAEAVGLPFERLEIDAAVAEEAVETIIEDGYPRNGIQRVHEHALERIAAKDYDLVGDGTRRDDRVPSIDRAAARSLEDRYGIGYVAPLAGFGRQTIDQLVEERLTVTSGPSETVGRADYEGELRARIADRWNKSRVETIFPAHEQSRVTGTNR